MIQIKNSDVLYNLALPWHPKLRLLIKYVADVAGIFITEGYRDKRHANDLHGEKPLRAIDGRSSIYTQPQIIANRINQKWIYDPERPDMKCAVYGDENHKDHIHFQVHPKTKFIGGNK